MVMAKTQIRSTLEQQNAQREKKIAQLNDFIARFAAGTRSSQVTSRRKEVERLQTNELAHSNIQRPYVRFDQLCPSGKHVLEFMRSRIHSQAPHQSCFLTRWKSSTSGMHASARTAIKRKLSAYAIRADCCCTLR